MPLPASLPSIKASRFSRGPLIAVALAAAWFWAAAWTASKDLPPVADEIAHITGGECHWRFGVNPLQPENGYVAMHWATLPLRLHPPAFPQVPPDMSAGSAALFVGESFFFESGNDPAAMLSAGRAMMALMGAALVLCIGWWGRILWGAAGGVLAAWLAAFCPTLLGNGGLVMSDVTTALGMLLTVTVWWALLQKITPLRILAGGLSVGFLFLCKMSGVLALPMLAVLVVIRLGVRKPLAWQFTRPRDPATGVRKFTLILVASAIAAVVAGLTLWAAFGFRYSMFSNPLAPVLQGGVTWETLLSGPGLPARLVSTLREWHLLPEAWLRGFAETTFYLKGRAAFLNGETSETGWVSYFPYACLVKTPLPLFALMGLGWAAHVRSKERSPGEATTENAPRPAHPLYTAAPLIVLFVIYWLFALRSQINIGQRHLLPVYAPLLILAGGAAPLLFTGKNAIRALVAALIVWFAAESLWIRPRYLSYFNAIAGGPLGGYRHLVDSNVDLGQDVIALKHWLDDPANRPKSTPVFLSFFGPANPPAYGVHGTRFADHGFDTKPRPYPPRITGGIFCISVTLFQGMYTLTAGPWMNQEETLYRQLAEIFSHQKPTKDQATLYEHLQFGRLRYFLANRPPDDRVGHSILIFRLSDAEVAQALYAPLVQPPTPQR